VKRILKNVFVGVKDVVKGFLDNNCSIHAAGLTYFSMLAIVPMLCVVLVSAKYLGVDDLAKRSINGYFDALIVNIEKGQDDDMVAKLPLGSIDEREKRRLVAQEFAKEARDFSNSLFERVESFDVGTFGLVGFSLLLWTVISSIGMIEISFNEIWKVEKPRIIWRRAVLNVSLAFIMPVLTALAISPQLLNLARKIIVATLGASFLTKWVGDGLVMLIDWTFFRFMVSYAVMSFAFAFFYWIMPNCKVRFSSAYYGGALTAMVFCLWLKVCAIAQIGIAKTSALYGSFAFLPIILAWMYMSWEIILFGANVVRVLEKGRSSK
jgi:membrane protein